MAMFENFPYTDMHNLNLDWIIKIAKDFLDQYTHIQQLISDGETSIQNLTDAGLDQLEEKAGNLEAALQAWYDTHSADIANQLTAALADLNAWYTTHQNDLNAILTENITLFNAAVNAKVAEALASIPSDYSTLTNTVTVLDAAAERNIKDLALFLAPHAGNVPDFARGNTSPVNGEYYNNILYRVTTPNILYSIAPITIKPHLNYRFNVIYFEDGVFTEATELTTEAYTIPANSEFKINIARTNEDTSETADISVFVSQLTYPDLVFERVKNNLNTLKEYLDFRAATESDFANGNISPTNGEYYDSVLYRVCTPNILHTNVPIRLGIKTGFRYNVLYYNNGLYRKVETTLITGEYVIPANTYYKIVITRVTENTAEVANIKEFVSALIYPNSTYNVLAKREEQVERNILNNTNLKYLLSSSDFERGQLNPQGVEYDLSYRIRTKDIMFTDSEIVLDVSKQFIVNLFFYDGYGSTTASSSNLNLVGRFSIPANSYYKILIRRATEDTSETANIDVFFNSLSFFSLIRTNSDTLKNFKNKYGKIIPNTIYQHSESDVYTVKFKPSALSGSLTLEKSEATNTGNYRTLAYVSLTNNTIGFLTPVSDSGTPQIYFEKTIPFSLVIGHEYFASLYKLNNEYCVIEITDGYSMNTFSMCVYLTKVGRSWGKGKYVYTGTDTDIKSTTTMVLQNTKPRLLIIGDSFVEGYSLMESGQNYTARFATMIKEALNGDCYIDARGGYGSYDVWDTLRLYLLPYVVKPEYMLVCVGTNDSNYNLYEGRMNAIIQLCEEYNITPIFMTVPCNTTVSSAIVAQMNNYIYNSGKAYIEANIPLSVNYDGVTPNTALKLADGVHPNAAGNLIIYKRALLDLPFLFN